MMMHFCAARADCELANLVERAKKKKVSLNNQEGRRRQANGWDGESSSRVISFWTRLPSSVLYSPMGVDVEFKSKV